MLSVTIPNSVVSIGNSAFAGCGSLQEFKGKFAADNGRILVIDGTLVAYARSGQTEYSIPDCVTTIGEEAFNSCNLTSITINDSVTSIKANVFIHNYNLRGIYCNATTPPLIDGSYTFNGTPSDKKIYVPYASIEAYKTASGWNKYASYMVAYDFEKGEVVE